MIPEIKITCSSGIIFTSSITVAQYKKYTELMEKNSSGRKATVMFFNKKIIQEVFENRISITELGVIEVVEFMEAVKAIHFIMQNVITAKLLDLVTVEQIEQEESAFDEYDIENGYDDENGIEDNIWKSCREILDRVIKISIRLMKNSYSQCMGEDIISLLDYFKFEIDTTDENK